MLGNYTRSQISSFPFDRAALMVIVLFSLRYAVLDFCFKQSNGMMSNPANWFRIKMQGHITLLINQQQNCFCLTIVSEEKENKAYKGSFRLLSVKIHRKLLFFFLREKKNKLPLLSPLSFDL